VKHLLGLASLDAAALTVLLDRTARCKAGEPRTPVKARVANLFFETSTRTRTSFEIAERALGLEVVSLAVQASSVQKGESLRDTTETLLAMGIRLVVIRHAASGAAAYVARRTKAQVVSAGDGQHEHPTQGLLDAFTLRERWGTLAGKTVTIIGDLRHSRVARSNLQALPKLGVKVRLFGPRALVPRELGADIAGSWDEAVRGADALMMLRLQHERMEQGFLPDLADYRRGFGLTEARAQALPEHVLVMHPGPMNRGVEIDGSVADGARSLVTTQVENGVFVRMAVLAQLLEHA
jgi:aspartate carbamoyltransferase catalytic subunit